jgi:acetolactate synthase-1/2/3 large subunit
MKASDYIIDYLSRRGVSHIFEVIGGMTAHLVDSAHRHNEMKLVSMHGEQAAALAAYGWARVTGIPGVAMATSGPGAVNLLTGIASCFFDSVPAIFITGQVNRNEQRGERRIRQLGFQETDIVSMALPVTKTVTKVNYVDSLPAILDDAFRTSLSGRPGPVLLDIPMDVQREELSNNPDEFWGLPVKEFTSDLDEVLDVLSHAERPLILAGGGISAAHATEFFRKFVAIVKVPVVHSLMAVDVLPHDHPLRVGMIGTYGNRWANTALGACDVLLVLGSRLDIRQTGSDVSPFAGKKIFHVDCEEGEINNRVKGCTPIREDLEEFLKTAVSNEMFTEYDHTQWVNEISMWREKWPDVSELRNIKGINPNVFMHELSNVSYLASAYTVDTGSNQMWAAQSLDLRNNQRFITSGGMGAMGFALPTAIGASLAVPGRPVVMIAGDGGMQMNIQELETIVHHKLPIKMVVMNNHSYGMVRQFQDSYFNGVHPGSRLGYSAPDFEKVASAYGIQSATIGKTADSVERGLSRMWTYPMEPFLLQVEIDPTTNVYPKIAFGHPLTQMERDE